MNGMASGYDSNCHSANGNERFTLGCSHLLRSGPGLSVWQRNICQWVIFERLCPLAASPSGTIGIRQPERYPALLGLDIQCCA
jgi:hypothetical protein